MDELDYKTDQNFKNGLKNYDRGIEKCWAKVRENGNSNRGGSGSPTLVPSVAPTGGFGNDL